MVHKLDLIFFCVSEMRDFFRGILASVMYKSREVRETNGNRVKNYVVTYEINMDVREYGNMKSDQICYIFFFVRSK